MSRTGQVFMTEEGPIKIQSSRGLSYRVTDPTVSHPQDSRYGTWEIDKEEFEQDLREGNIEHATLKAEVVEE